MSTQNLNKLNLIDISSWMEQVSMNPYPYLKSYCYWWCWREKDIFSFRGIDTSGLTKLHRMAPHPWVHGQCKLHFVFYEKKEKKMAQSLEEYLGEIRWGGIKESWYVQNNCIHGENLNKFIKHYIKKNMKKMSNTIKLYEKTFLHTNF